MKSKGEIQSALDDVQNELKLWEAPDERRDVIFRMMKAYEYALALPLSSSVLESNISERLDRAKKSLIEISQLVPSSSASPSWYIVSSYRDALLWLLGSKANVGFV